MRIAKVPIATGQAHLNSIQRLPTNLNDETNAPLYLKKVFRNGWMTLPIVRDFSAVELNDEMQRSKNLDALALPIAILWENRVSIQ